MLKPIKPDKPTHKETFQRKLPLDGYYLNDLNHEVLKFASDYGLKVSDVVIGWDKYMEVTID